MTYMAVWAFGVWGNVTNAEVTSVETQDYRSCDCSQVSFSSLLNSRYIKIYARGTTILGDGLNRATMYKGVMSRAEFSKGPPFFGKGILSRSILDGGSRTWPYEHVVNIGHKNYITLYRKQGGFASYLKPLDNRCLVSDTRKEVIFYSGTYKPQHTLTDMASGGFVESWLVRITGHNSFPE